MLEQVRAEIRRRAEQAERECVARDAERIRVGCRSLAGFVREAWHVLEPSNSYIHGWHIDAICRHLEAVTDGRITRLLINVPPGTMKSLIVSVFWPAWEWGPRGLPSIRYLTTSYEEELVLRDNLRMRRLVEGDWYQSLWGSTVQLAKDQNAKGRFENTATGVRDGRPFGSLTGGRGDRVIIDDPHSTKTAESEAQRMEAIKTFRESVPTRVNDPRHSAIIVIMQRLHQSDVSGCIDRLGLPYVHLMLPMEFELERRCSTSIGFEDPRTFDGELLFPERFPREVVDRDKVPLGAYGIAGQMQQRPAPREGGMFKRADFEVVGALPPIVKWVRAWDFAASKKRLGTEPDWSVGLKMGRGLDGKFYITDIRRERETPGKVRQLLVNTASQDKAETYIRIPKDPGQAGIAQVEDFVTALAGYIVTALPPTGSKETRAKPLASQAEVGNVKLLSAVWNETFLDEVELFPAGTHDDQVDAAADAFNELAGVQPGEGLIEFYRREAGAKAAKAANGHANGHTPAPACLRMKAPLGISTVYGMSGRAYQVDEGGLVAVSESDAAPLRAQGFVQTTPS